MKKTAKTLVIHPKGIAYRVNPFGGALGESERVLNLRERNDALEVVGAPKQLASLPDGYRLVFIDSQDCDGAQFFIAVKGTDLILHGCLRNGVYSVIDRLLYPLDGEIIAINRVGNFLVVSTSVGRRFFLCSKGYYTPLAIDKAIPNFVLGTADFNTRKATISGFDFSTPYTRWANPLSASDQTTLTTNVRDAFSRLCEATAADGYFLQPMAVRYAVRLFDNSFLWVSAPVIVGNGVQCADLFRAEVTSNSSGFSHCADTEISATAYHIGLSLLGAPSSEWDALIKSIDILASSELEPFTPSTLVDYRCESSQSGTRQYFLASQLKQAEYNVALNDIINPDSWRTICSITDIQGLRMGIVNASNVVSAITSDSGDVPSVAIKMSGIFNGYIDSHILNKVTSAIRHEVVDECAISQNGRLYAGTKSLIMASPWQCSSSWAGPLLSKPCRAMVTTKIRTSAGIATKVLLQDFDVTPSALNPLIAYPDPRAMSISIKVLSDGQILECSGQLANCDRQGYAFDVADALDKRSFSTGFSFLAFSENNTVEDGASILSISAPHNPLVFGERRAICDGHIHHIAAAVKTIYSSVFGRYPIYAFTDSGIYAVAYKATGDYKDAQLIDRSRTSSAGAIAASNEGVFFIADDDSLCLISGKKVKRILNDCADIRQIAWERREHELFLLHSDGHIEVLMPCGRTYHRDIVATRLFGDYYSAIITDSANNMLSANIQLPTTLSISLSSHPFASPVHHDFAPVDLRCDIATTKASGRFVLKGFSQSLCSAAANTALLDFDCATCNILHTRIYSPRIKAAKLTLAAFAYSGTLIRNIEIDYI